MAGKAEEAELRAPVAPMLAQLARELPAGAFIYEPKWDGFRCIAFVAGGEAQLWSRNRRRLDRYFPEIAEALARAELPDCVFDGELVVMNAQGFDFASLMNRIHPAASRVQTLRAQAPATFIVFDALRTNGQSLCARGFAERRAALESLAARFPERVVLTPATDDVAKAESWLKALRGRGVDGVVAKSVDLTYQPGKRVMIKVKQQHSIDCVVAGMRVGAEGPAVSSLLLGLYDGCTLRHVGVCGGFSRDKRAEMLAALWPERVPLEGHPWQHGFQLGRSPMGRLPGSAGRWDPSEMTLDWIPLRPSRVCEVTADQIDDGRFRHPARLVRWRPDRDAGSCSIDQLAPAAAVPHVEVGITRD